MICAFASSLFLLVTACSPPSDDDDASATVQPSEVPTEVAFTVSASSLEFGTVSVGESLERRLEVSNASESDLLLTVTLPYNPAGQYSVATDSGAVPDSLEAGATQTLVVTFEALENDDAAGVLRFDTSDPKAPRVDVLLTAVGQATGRTDNDGDGVAIEEGDCDDASATTYPGAPERCDGEDNDCNGLIDDEASDEFYEDRDQDGYGDDLSMATGCTPPEGYVAIGGDCNDQDAAVNPSAEEVCDGLDNDCDGGIDVGLALTFYADADGDGFGDPDAFQEACEAPEGYVAAEDSSFDCDDTDPLVYPNALEACDGVDNDCNGFVDDTGDLTFYQDADGDGFGDAEEVIQACARPDGYVEVEGGSSFDCDDNDSLVYPGAPESCDGHDNDCDGEVDEDGVSTFYRDYDKDGHGDATVSLEGCNNPSGYVSLDDDCDDRDGQVYPGAAEVCNGQDDNCNGEVDEDVETIWYLDADRDGYGDPAETVVACTRPTRYVSEAGDCDDLDSSVNPGAPELCDNQDNNCDGSIDEDVLRTFYADVDRDGYGDPEVSYTACTATAGMVNDNTDCNDAQSSVYPGALEVCDGLDNNCDAQIDEDVKSTWYGDTDGDGYGTASVTIQACAAPTGYVANATDCDDDSAATYPNANEFCDGQDNDCDGTIDEGVGATFYADADEDGYGDPGSTGVACEAGGGLVGNKLDCNDQDATIYPGAPELCDGLDNDCDDGQAGGGVDEPGDSSQNLYYLDADGDGYGKSAPTTYACSLPDGYSENDDDCRDNDAHAYPGAPERCIGKDDNCDGEVSPPSPPEPSSNTPLCEGEDLALYSTVVTGAEYAWTGPDGFSSDVSEPVLPSVTEAASGTYSVTVEVDGCVSEPATTEVTVWAPKASFTMSANTPSILAPITFFPDETGATYEWTFEGGDPAESSAENPVVTWTEPGSYEVTLLVSADGCIAEESQTVTVVDYYQSCEDALTKNPSAEDGVYTIDPDGSGSVEPFQVYCDMSTAGGGWALIYYVDGEHFDGYMANNKVANNTPVTQINDQADMWNPPSSLSYGEALFACTTQDDQALYYWTYDSTSPIVWFTGSTDYQYQNITSVEENTSEATCMSTHKAESGYGFVVLQTSGCGNCQNMLFGNYHYTSSSQCNNTDNSYGTHVSPWRSVTVGYPLCNMQQTSNGRFWIGIR